MNPESIRIATQLRHAFAGQPWHGPPLSELLADVTPEQAIARPFPRGHNIQELVLHIDAWVQAALGAAQGIAMPKLYGTEKDWQVVTAADATAWADASTRLFEGGEQLARIVEEFPDARLRDIVPGREYDFYYLFHGIVQHSLYHAGQIALNMKMVSSW
jgi:DinB superfamily